MADIPEILFLRPFWKTNTTVTQLRAMARTVRGIGALVTLRNSRQNTRIRLTSDVNPWSRYGSLMEKFYNVVNPALDLRLIASTDDDWQKDAIREIIRCKAVILHIAPHEGQNHRDFMPIKPGRILEKTFNRLRNPVHESGIGHGLLRELEYCRQVSALAKTIVVVQAEFYSRVCEVVSALDDIHNGIQHYMVLDEGLLPLQPRISAVDQALTALRDVHAIVPYKWFSGRAFNIQLRSELLTCLSLSGRTSPEQEGKVLSGIPSGPIALPPDGELKWIRFSRLESLTKIPPLEIVELSIDEVKKCNPDLLAYYKVCKGCGRGPEVMFFYQRGRTPRLEPGVSVHMDCQYCGFRDYY